MKGLGCEKEWGRDRLIPNETLPWDFKNHCSFMIFNGTTAWVFLSSSNNKHSSTLIIKVLKLVGTIDMKHVDFSKTSDTLSSSRLFPYQKKVRTLLGNAYFLSSRETDPQKKVKIVGYLLKG